MALRRKNAVPAFVTKIPIIYDYTRRKACVFNTFNHSIVRLSYKNRHKYTDLTIEYLCDLTIITYKNMFVYPKIKIFTKKCQENNN